MSTLTQRAKHWISGAVLLLVLLLAFPWLIAWRMQTAATAMSRQMTSPLASISILEELALTADQKKQIQQLEDSYRSEMRKFCGQHCSARMKIGEMLQSGKVDSKDLPSWGKEAGNAYSGAEQATIQHLVRVCEVLSPGQKEILLKKVADHIAATCPKEFMQ